MLVMCGVPLSLCVLISSCTVCGLLLLRMHRTAKNDSVTSCVVDAEVVAYDRDKGCLLPFQILSTRKRKVEDGEEEQKVRALVPPYLYGGNEHTLQTADFLLSFFVLVRCD